MTTRRTQITAFALVALLAIAAVGVFAFGPQATVAAQDEPQDAPAPVATLPRTITVVGEGTVAVQPDVASIQIGVEMTGASADEASTAAADTMDAILAALTRMRIPSRDIQTSNYSIFVERPMTPEGTPSGDVIYHVNNVATVTIRNLATVSDVIDAAIEAGANNIYGVSFEVDDEDEVMVDARSEAAANALARAQELAALHNVEIGEVVSISEVISGNAIPFETVNVAMAFDARGGPIAPGELELTARLQVVYAIAGSANAQ
jgi:uncharacterized protein YggE